MERAILFLAVGFALGLATTLIFRATSLRRRAKANKTFFDKLVADTHVDVTPHGYPAAGTTHQAPSLRAVLDDLAGDERRHAGADAAARRRDDEDAAAARRRRESDEAAQRAQQDLLLQSTLLAVHQHGESARAQMAQERSARGHDSSERDADTPTRSDDAPSAGYTSSWSSSSSPSSDSSSSSSSSFSSSGE